MMCRSRPALFLAQKCIEQKTAPNMDTRPAQMPQNLSVRATRFFECIGQHGEAVCGEVAGWQFPFLVGSLCQRHSNGCPPGRVQAVGAEGTAHQVTEQCGLKALLRPARRLER